MSKTQVQLPTLAAHLAAHLAAIVDSSDDAIVSKDVDGCIQSWNKGAERLFGYMAEEMIGGSIAKLLPDDRPNEEMEILARLRKGERIDQFQTVRVRKDGQRVDVSVTISPILDADGRVVGASKVARDISDRLQLEVLRSQTTEELEQRVRERTAALEAANREMEAFTHTLAHDLRSPIRAIQATSLMIAEDLGDSLDEETKGLLDRQVQASQRLSQLIDDLLSYSHLGRFEVVPQELDLTQICRELAATLCSSHPSCTFEVQDDLHAVGDRSLVKLALQNLMENACKFSPNGGPVIVGKKDDAFYVQDSGIGFNMAYVDKVFMPFERLVRNDEFPGTGIGLATVKRILEKHKGSIWVNSAQGEGATFYFTLP